MNGTDEMNETGETLDQQISQAEVWVGITLRSWQFASKKAARTHNPKAFAKAQESQRICYTAHTKAVAKRDALLALKA